MGPGRRILQVLLSFEREFRLRMLVVRLLGRGWTQRHQMKILVVVLCLGQKKQLERPSP